MPREALIAQGFPIYKSLSFGVATCSFALDDGQPDAVLKSISVAPSDPCTSGRTAIAGMAGNAMHMESVAVHLLFILTRGGMSVRSNADHFPLCRPGVRLKDQLNGALFGLGKMFMGL